MNKLSISALITLQKTLHTLKSKPSLFPFYLVLKPAYSILSSILGIDIPPSVKVGKNLRIYHGTGLVIHPVSIIGNNVVLRHSTTIGSKALVDQDPENKKAPTIEDNVNIGAHSLVIGDITIGSNSIIGAGSRIFKSVPPNSVVLTKSDLHVTEKVI